MSTSNGSRSSASVAAERQLIATLDAALDPAAQVVLAGRVTAVSGTQLLLTDVSGSLRLQRAPAVPTVRAGDIVRMVARRRDGEWHALALELLTSPTASEPFPSPGSEHYRLHCPLRSGGVRPPSELPHRLALLQRRSRIFAAVRAFFAERDYVEVHPPHRVRLPGLEPHLVALPAGDHFLITSPEYHMKRLLAGGLERIYSMGPCWRGDETGPHHLDEFTMLEWYRAYSDIDQLMQETEALMHHVALRVTGSATVQFQGRPLELAPPYPRLTFAQACERYAGVELHGVADAHELRARAEAAGLGPFAADEPFDAVASRILVDRVEPALARLATPVFLYDFPAPLAALSALRPDDPSVAQRFELYAHGLELANAFFELTDAREQRRRLELDREQRREAGNASHALDERFLAALAQGMPPTAGIALGVDRLVMLLCDAADIRDAVAFAPQEV